MLKRIFIALKVEPEETFLVMMSSLKSRLGNEIIRWVNPENIHLTLSFLGDTDEETVNLIYNILRKQCSGSGKLEFIIRGLDVFKSPANPRVIWTGIESSEKLSELNSLVVNGLKSIGIIMEDRPFKPHLTLGRIKRLNNKNALKALLEKYQDKEIQKVQVNEVIIYESILLQTGAVYKPLFKVKL